MTLNNYAHIVRIDQSRLYKQIFDKIWNCEDQSDSIIYIKEMLKKFSITENDTTCKQKCRNKMFGLGVLVVEKTRGQLSRMD